jgi:hypothetical protein
MNVVFVDGEPFRLPYLRDTQFAGSPTGSDGCPVTGHGADAASSPERDDGQEQESL